MNLLFIQSFFSHLFHHLERVFNSIYGFVLFAATFLFNLLEPEAFGFGVVFAAIVLDLVCGLAVAIKLKAFVLSKLLRDTSLKIGGYSFTLLMVFLIEDILHDGNFIGFKVAAAIAAACELWSMSASILIIYPNFPFLKILRLQLKGEIESKTGKNLDHILNDKDNVEQP